MKPKYITDIDKITSIPEEERKQLKPITDKFVFRVNDYYLNLIDWDDPNDPIRKLVIPNKDELGGIRTLGRIGRRHELCRAGVPAQI